jgi:hypothetical protein
MAGFTLLDDEEVSVELSNGDLLEIIPEENLDDHAPDEALESDVEDVGEIAEGLEACHDMLAQAAAANAMNPQAAQFAGLAIQLAERNIRGNFSNGLGKALEGKGKYGLEDFEDKASGTAYASYAMLGIMDTLGNVWEKIVTFLKSWFDKIAAWFNKYLSGAAFAKRKAQAVINKAENVKGSLKSEEMNISPMEYMNLTVGTKFSPEKAITDTLAALKDVKIGEISKTVESMIAEIKIIKIKDSGSALKLDKKTENTLAGWASKVSGTGFSEFNDSRYKSSPTEKHFKLGNIGGGLTLIMTLSGKEADNVVWFTRASMSSTKTKPDSTGEKKIKGLQGSAVISLAKTALSACEDLISQKDMYRAGKGSISKLDGELKSVIASLKGSVGGGKNGEYVGVISGFVNGLVSTVTVPYNYHKTLQSQTLTSVNSALNYCLKSLSHHKVS